MRLSKRLRREAPTPVANLIAEAIASNPTKIALRASLTSGGRSGRLKNPLRVNGHLVLMLQALKTIQKRPTETRECTHVLVKIGRIH